MIYAPFTPINCKALILLHSASPFLGTPSTRTPQCRALKNSKNHNKMCYVSPSFHTIFTPNMASFSRRKDTWRASVCRKGVRKTATFSSKAAAVAWAGRIEADILAGERGEIPNKIFGDLLDRYETEVSAAKKGARWESVRIGMLKRDAIATKPLRTLGSPDVAAWRDRRLRAVSEASVRREWNLLSHACAIAIREWHWLKTNPFTLVRRPRSGQPRNRVLLDAEWELLKATAETPSQVKVLRVAEWALETGMRAGEICGLRAINGRVAVLEDTKNGTRREVPLSARAVELWDGGFELTPATLDVHWRGLCAKAGVTGLHFHDLRGTCATRLSKKLNILQLARMLGHKDTKMLLTYYRETAEDVAKLL